jgi:threonine aldolase
MRQAGFLAAAALYALDNNVERLVDDHENAGRLAGALADLEGVKVLNDPVETNLVFFDVSGAGKNALEIMNDARDRGVLINPEELTVMRAVTHLNVSREDIDRAIDVFREIICG